MSVESVGRLESQIGSTFRDRTLLLQALTHRSATAPHGNLSNERLEFLGDAVIGVIVAELLFEKYPGHAEGDLAKSKSYIVSEASLARAAEAIQLADFIRVSAAEAMAGGQYRRSILADALEAVVGAHFLDRGIRATRKLVRSLLQTAIQESQQDEHRKDYKSALQERTQAMRQGTPTYLIASEAGHDHDKTFEAHAIVAESVVGEGMGKTKKEAEQAAALDALNRMHAPD